MRILIYLTFFEFSVILNILICNITEELSYALILTRQMKITFHFASKVFEVSFRNYYQIVYCATK